MDKEQMVKKAADLRLDILTNAEQIKSKKASCIFGGRIGFGLRNGIVKADFRRLPGADFVRLYRAGLSSAVYHSGTGVSGQLSVFRSGKGHHQQALPG